MRVSNRFAKAKPNWRFRIRMSYSPSWNTLVRRGSASTSPSGRMSSPRSGSTSQSRPPEEICTRQTRSW
jgi:hypothetical protein